MGRKIKRLSGLEIDEVSLVDRPANQHGLVSIAKRQEDVMPGIYDADGVEVEEEELTHGDYVYDDDGNEFVFLEEDPGEVLYYEDENELESVGKAGTRVGAKGVSQRWGALKEGFGAHAAEGKTIRRNLTSRAKKPLREFRSGRAATSDFRQQMHGLQVGQINKPGTSGANFAGRVAGSYDPLKVGLTGAAGAGLGGAGYATGRRRGTKSASLGDEVLESLSKAFTDDDRNEVIAKAMDYVQDVSARNEQLENQVYDILEDRDVEGYYELAKSYDLPADPQEIAALMYRASMSLPEEDVEFLDRIFTATGEFSKAYYDEIGFTGGYEGSALGEVYAAAGDVVSKAAGGLTQEQAVTALFDANPAAYDEYEAEQRYNR